MRWNDCVFVRVGIICLFGFGCRLAWQAGVDAERVMVSDFFALEHHVLIKSATDLFLDNECAAHRPLWSQPASASIGRGGRGQAGGLCAALLDCRRSWYSAHGTAADVLFTGVPVLALAREYPALRPPPTPSPRNPTPDRPSPAPLCAPLRYGTQDDGLARGRLPEHGGPGAHFQRAQHR